MKRGLGTRGRISSLVPIRAGIRPSLGRGFSLTISGASLIDIYLLFLLVTVTSGLTPRYGTLGQIYYYSFNLESKYIFEILTFY